jgi:3-oxoacyl-[acyl-carrier-protein] synthase-3
MRVISVASAIPETVVSNETVEARLGLDRGWIEKRTGILQRPTASLKEATSDLAVRAGQQAMQRAKLDPQEVGLLLLATSTPDHLLPPTAPLVAHRLCLLNAGAIDLTGACAGFLYALVLADDHGRHAKKPVLVIAANVLTRRVDETDPSTASLFSDGAGAVVLVPAREPHVLGSWLGADGSSYDVIGIQAGGAREPITTEAIKEGRHLMTMRRGPALFKKAVGAMAFAGRQAMAQSGLDASAIDWWIPHQANVRLTRDTGTALGIPPERTIDVVGRYGNSSAATIPTALAHAVDSGQIREGQTLLLTAVGAGMLSAGVVLRW